MWKYILWKVSGLFSLLICKVETQTHLKTRQRVCLMILTGNQRSRPGLSDPPGPRGGPSCLELEGEGGEEVEVRLTEHTTVQRQVHWLVKLGKAPGSLLESGLGFYQFVSLYVVNSVSAIKWSSWSSDTLMSVFSWWMAVSSKLSHPPIHSAKAAT